MVKLALEERRLWLEGSPLPFLVWTDHKNFEDIKMLRTASWMPCPGSSRQMRSRSEAPNPSFLRNCVVASLTMDVEERLQAASTSQPGRSTCPDNCLFVLAPLRTEMLEWSHASRLACHPGGKNEGD